MIATVREVGRLGNARIIEVQYALGKDPAGIVLIAERRQGAFAPLMTWFLGTGIPQPSAAIVEARGTQVLAIEYDFGGALVHNTYSWAWIWTSAGPLLLDVDTPMTDAVREVAPDYDWFCDNFDWRTLQSQTFPWKEPRDGAWEVDTWYDIKNGKLIAVRAEMRDRFDADIPVKRWP